MTSAKTSHPFTRSPALPPTAPHASTAHQPPHRCPEPAFGCVEWKSVVFSSDLLGSGAVVRCWGGLKPPRGVIR
uniref:Uncharacterized protein n=1 Tax=Knipowitschia caucasica TaxID=637954 RepID=A0AAV2KSI4_KNICA